MTVFITAESTGLYTLIVDGIEKQHGLTLAQAAEEADKYGTEEEE